MRPALFFALLCSLCACAPGDDPAQALTAQRHEALTHQVPGDFATIGEAVRAARDGDEVVIAAGTYDESFVVDGKSITVRGAGIGRTVVRRGVSLRNSAQSRLIDLSFEGQGGGIGVFIDRQLVRLSRVSVTGFRTGIFVRRAFGDFQLDGSTVFGNVVGLEMTQVLGGRVASSVFHSNLHAGIRARDGVERFAIVHNTVVGNGFGAEGALDAGIALGPFGREAVQNNIVVGNRAGIGCDGCRSSFGHNNVWGNVVDYEGDAAPAATDLSVDPLFVAPHERDFHLRAASPCLDVGVDVGIGFDADRQPRPAGEGPDLGAFERRAEVADLAINEVMANPLDETTGEFVEIVNRSNRDIALAGFRLDDGDAEDVLVAWPGEAAVVPAGGLAVVLDPDFADDYALPAEVVRLTVADARLGNGLAVGDPITLRDPDGALLSTYADPFNPGNGVSAERLRPDAAEVRASWVASPCGASPGAVNCVLEPPQAEPETRVVISEVMANPLDEGTGEFVELYNAADGPIDVDRWRISDGDEEDLVLGWQRGPTEIPPGGYAVILDPGYAGQYPIPEDALRLRTTGATIGNALSISDPITLRDRDGALQASWSTPFDPGNGRSAERIDLAGPDARDNWVAAPCEGPVRASPGAPNCAGVAPPPVADAPLAITEVMANPFDEDRGEFVELYNFGDAPFDAATLLLDDGDAVDTLEALDGGSTVVPPGGFAVILDPEHDGTYALPDEAVLLRPDDTTLGSGLTTNDVVRLLDVDQTVVSSWLMPFNPGNGRSVERIALDREGPEVWIASPCPSGASPGRANCAGDIGAPPEPAAPPALVITEVMANPLDDRLDEWVEVLNVGEAAVDLSRLRFFDGDALDTLEPFEGGSTRLAPGQYGVIVDRDYGGGQDIAEGALLVTTDDRTLGSGLSTSDPVSILLDDGVTAVSRFSFPADPGNGRSIVRISPDAPDAAESWRPTECADGRMSTPGRADCAVDAADLDCRAQADCAEGLRCNGIPHDRATDLGRCVDFARREGQDAPCPGPDYACGPGLACMGWSLNLVRPRLWPDPFCVRGWQAGRFEGAPGAIPDTGRLTSAAVVYGLATVPVDIVVTARISHPDPSQLTVTLFDPGGQDGLVFDGAVDDPAILDGPVVVLGNISRDASVNGRWTLRVEDGAEGRQGDLDGWTLEIVSNFD